MTSGTIVMVTLKDPQDRIWGALRDIRPDGITVQGIRIETLDEFVRQTRESAGNPPAVPATFYPLRRLDNFQWDPTDADLAIYASRFREQMGVTIEEFWKKHAPADNGGK